MVSVLLGVFCVPEVFLFFSSSVFTSEPNYIKSCLPRLPVEIVFGLLLELEWQYRAHEHTHMLVDIDIDVSSKVPLLAILGSSIASVKPLL